MRLLIVGINFEPERTGIAPYTTALARHLAKRHEVTVLTGVPHYPDWTVPEGFRQLRTESVVDGVRVIRLRHFVPSKPSVVSRATYELSFAAQAARVGLAIPADAVIAVVPPLFGTLAARVIARRQRIPFGVIVQDIMGTAAAQSGVRGGRSISSLATSLERSALRSASSVATIHPRLASELHRISPRCKPPAVIYNWTHVTAPTRSTEQARELFGWPDDTTIALHSGNMGCKQNLEVVVDAARIAARTDPTLRFVLAGGGSQRQHLERYAAGCPNLAFLNGVEDCDYTDLLRSADVLLVNERPGMREMSLPSKITSYLYAGRPIVAATDSSSATGEFVAATGGGIVTTAGDPQALLDTVVRVAADRDTAYDLTKRGQEFARINLSRDQALTAYDRWADNLLDQSR